MNPDTSPPLPPELLKQLPDYFSQPVHTRVLGFHYTRDCDDLLFVSQVPHWIQKQAPSATDDEWVSFRLGSPIALANGIGVEEEPNCENCGKPLNHDQTSACSSRCILDLIAKRRDEGGIVERIPLATSEPESPKPEEIRFADMTELVKENEPTPTKPALSATLEVEIIRGNINEYWAERFTKLESDLAAARAIITEKRPLADCYERVCKSLGIENDILGFVRSKDAEIHRLRAALEEISKQRLWSEMSEEDRERGSFEDGYDACIGIARAALALAPASSGKGEG